MQLLDNSNFFFFEKASQPALVRCAPAGSDYFTNTPYVVLFPACLYRG